MKSFPPPPGFQTVKLPHAFAWFRTNRPNVLLPFWRKAGTHLRLSEVVRRHPQSLRFSGRLPVFAAPFSDGKTWVVRTCAHGGWWGRVARDLYLGPGRALREIRASERLAQGKIPTPRIEAVIFYPTGLFCRIEVVTVFVPKSRDLVQHLARRPGIAERTRLFSAVRKLLDQLHRHDIRHPDLNARNILLAPSPRGGFSAWLLDVDVVRSGGSGDQGADPANRHRLLRSLFKRARLGDLGWSEAEVTKLWRELFPRR